MSTFSADQIVGKGLIANRTVQLFYDATLSQPAYTVAPDDPVGVVFSYLQPTYGNGAGKFVWIIQGAFNRNLYVVHEQGKFKEPVDAKSMEVLKKEAEEKAARENEGIEGKILRVIKPIAIIAAVAFAAVKIGGIAVEKGIDKIGNS